MTMLHTISISVACGVTGVFLTGCVTSSAPSHPGVIAEWTGTFYTLQLQGSPNSSNPTDNHASYRFSRSSGNRKQLSIESGLLAGDFTPKPFYNPKDVVRLIEGSDGKHLLIEEDISNDCWPHRNYILVSVPDSMPLDHSYLKVPEAPHAGTPNDPSKLIKLEGDMLTFRYANGITERRRLKNIPKMTRPLPPG